MSEHLGFDIDHTVDRLPWGRGRIDGKRILYVDDEPLMRSAVARLLRGAGAVCIGAATHDAAVALLSFEPALDLAILDFQMPDGDVSRLVRRLRQQRPLLPLLGTSGADFRSEFAARGVADFLPKPWAIVDLIRVADWLEARGQLPTTAS